MCVLPSATTDSFRLAPSTRLNSALCLETVSTSKSVPMVKLHGYRIEEVDRLAVAHEEPDFVVDPLAAMPVRHLGDDQGVGLFHHGLVVWLSVFVFGVRFV